MGIKQAKIKNTQSAAATIYNFQMKELNTAAAARAENFISHGNISFFKLSDPTLQTAKFCSAQSEQRVHFISRVFVFTAGVMN